MFSIKEVLSMKMNNRASTNALGLACLLLFSGPSCVYAADADLVARGRALYVDDCGGCHGSFAHGDGEVAKILTIPPADLTVLSKDNGGQFPEDYVRRAIDGRDLPPTAHGQVAMPVWGQHYRRNLLAYSEEVVQRKLDELVAYLKSIQVE
jgi:mono/diheme cytochrome c family protein